MVIPAAAATDPLRSPTVGDGPTCLVGGTLPQLPALRPLVDRWLTVSDLRDSSRARYQQSWDFLFETLPAKSTLADLTSDWWLDFVESRKEVGNSTLNRDRAAYLAFRNWAKGQKKPVNEFESQGFKEEPEQSRILTPEEIKLVRESCRPDRWPLFWALLGTGARQGEILNLRREDVTRRPGSVTILS